MMCKIVYCSLLKSNCCSEWVFVGENPAAVWLILKFNRERRPRDPHVPTSTVWDTWKLLSCVHRGRYNKTHVHDTICTVDGRTTRDGSRAGGRMAGTLQGTFDPWIWERPCLCLQIFMLRVVYSPPGPFRAWVGDGCTLQASPGRGLWAQDRARCGRRYVTRRMKD